MAQIGADTGRKRIVYEQPPLPPFICVPLRNLRFKLRIFLTADVRGWGESRTRLFRSGFFICVYPSYLVKNSGAGKALSDWIAGRFDSHECG